MMISRFLFMFYTGTFFLLCMVSNIVLAGERIVLLLPQTSDEQLIANKAIAKGMREVLGAQVMMVNRDAYSDMEETWRAVMRLHPNAVVGPLYEVDVASLARLDPKIPVLALNQSPEYHKNIWQLSMPTELPVDQLVLYFAEKEIEKILVLTHQNAMSDRLYKKMLAIFSGNILDSVSYSTMNELAAATRVLLHSTKGRSRLQTITTLLEGESIHGYPWARQDADAIVVIAPLADALNLSYQIDYLWGQSLSLYWIDSGSNALPDYVRSASNWGRMKTFMPQYQLVAMQQNTIETSFFEALGRDAGRLLQLRLGREVWDDGSILEGSLGELSMGDKNGINIKLPLVWLGDGQVDLVER